MDWFERLTGFVERGSDVRARLRVDSGVDGNDLVIVDSGARFGIGDFEFVSLLTLRERARAGSPVGRRSTLRLVRGDVRRLHRQPENAGAVFQVASQFNLLEMVSPGVTPEQGVTRYAFDPTQGPACAIACGAATIFRNYFVRCGDDVGQTASRQLDGLAAIGARLSTTLLRPVSSLWHMQNGYALCSDDGLDAINAWIAAADEASIDELRADLSVGVHRDAEVTDVDGDDRPKVTQVFCSALPVAYGRPPTPSWEPFATLILEAAYEATLVEAALRARAGHKNTVLLTALGGGAFGNPQRWIVRALRRALDVVKDDGLDVAIVSYAAPSAEVADLVAGLVDEF